MAKQSQQSGKKKAAAKGSSGKLIGRIIVYSLLAVLVVLGILDYRVKNQATATGIAWRDVQKSLKVDEEFLQSQLEQYVQGSPSKESRKAHKMGDKLVASITTYRWSGLIRNYDIYVGFGMGEDPAVEVIDGPGVPDPLVKE